MSTRIMGLCWPLTMRPPAKAVLIALADMANDEGFCWPSIDRLCERTCYGRTAVIDAIAWLEAHGAVRANRTNGRKTTYWVEPEKFVAEGVDNPPNQSAARTGTPDGPVRHADGTSPPGGRVPVRRADTNRQLIVKEPSRPPVPPADAVGSHAAAAKPRAEVRVTDGFEAVWAIYPRQAAEQQARRAWAAAAPDAALAVRILAAVQVQLQGREWQRLIREGHLHLIPKLSTWLRGQRWRDGVGVPLAPGVWDASRPGIEAMAARHGIGPWDQAAFDRGEGEAFPRYEARVRKAMRAQEACHAH